MKLSEMSTDKFADTIEIIVPIVGEIVEEDHIAAAFESISKGEANGKPKIQYYVWLLNQILFPLIKYRREQVYKIVSVLGGKTVEELRNESVSQMRQDIKNIWDGDLQALFIDA